MKSATPIPDPLVSRRGNVYSLQGVRRLLAAMAVPKKNEKFFPSPYRSVDNRCNAGKGRVVNSQRKKRNHEQI